MHDLAHAGHPIVVLPMEVINSTDANLGGLTNMLSIAVHMILQGAHHAPEALRIAEDVLAQVDRGATPDETGEFEDEHLVFKAYRDALNPQAFYNNIKLLPTTDARVVRIALADCLRAANQWVSANYGGDETLMLEGVKETISKLEF